MANKPSDVSFAIRFKPSSFRDDDDDDDNDVVGTNKETVLFERQNISGLTDNGGSQAIDIPISHSHPDTLFKNSPTNISRSAPASEIATPRTPQESNTINEKLITVKPSVIKEVPKDGSPAAEKSLFSGLRERLDRFSAESKEIFDRKMRRSGSADAAKITALLNAGDVANTPSTESPQSSELRHSRSPSNGSIACSEEPTESSTSTPVDQCSNSNVLCSATASSTIHKSASVDGAQLTKNVNPSTISSLDWRKRLSVATENEVGSFRLTEKIAMSNLRTSYSDFELRWSSNDQTVSCTTPIVKEACVVDEKGDGKPNSRTSKFKGKLLNAIETLQKRRHLLAALVGLIAYLLVPLPAYLSGFITGSLCSVIITIAYLQLTRWMKPETSSKALPSTASLEVKQQTLSRIEKKDVVKAKAVDEEKFKGWMNELSRYDVDDYHITQTHSVLVTLEGTTLRLQTPKHGIPKRAIVDESIPQMTFVRQRHFDLLGGRAYLLPSNLCSKRLWSKKYPICIEPSMLSKTRVFEVAGREVELSRNRSKEWTSLADVSGKRNGETERPHDQLVLYLFARTCREKEEWYRRFLAASRGTPWPLKISDGAVFSTSRSTSPERVADTSTASPRMKHKRTGSTDSTGSSLSLDLAKTPVTEVDYGLLSPEQNLAEYVKYMTAILSTNIQNSADDNCSGTSSPTDAVEGDESGVTPEPSLVWLNALIGRCFFDFLREKYWAEKMREKIQKKLCKMHVPHFIDQLSVTGIELGTSVPSVCRVYPPFLDDRGLWVDLDVTYAGGFCISMATKCNLMKLKQSTASTDDLQDLITKDKRSGVTHSDEEDSAESTTDEENVEDNSAVDATEDKRSQPMGKKLLRFVDKISQSRYFQQATEYKYIKKAMEEVSNTPLVLNVELCSINGTLSINIPPPPSDRIWYGFRGNPDLVLSAKPYVGERQVSLSPVTDWIEKKLAIEFQRVFVMPNMDDLPIPLMCPHL